MIPNLGPMWPRPSRCSSNGLVLAVIMVGGELAFPPPAFQGRDQTNKEATWDQILSNPPPPMLPVSAEISNRLSASLWTAFPLSTHWPRLTSATSISSILLLGLLPREASLKLPSESGRPSSKVKVPSSCPPEDLFYGEKNKTLKDLEINLPSWTNESGYLQSWKPAVCSDLCLSKVIGWSVIRLH